VLVGAVPTKGKAGHEHGSASRGRAALICQGLGATSLQRRVACEPDLLRVLVQTNAGLEIDNGTIVTNFGAVSVGGNVLIQNCSEVDC
jgi:hypothetical protein